MCLSPEYEFSNCNGKTVTNSLLVKQSIHCLLVRVSASRGFGVTSEVSALRGYR